MAVFQWNFTYKNWQQVFSFGSRTNMLIPVLHHRYNTNVQSLQNYHTVDAQKLSFLFAFIINFLNWKTERFINIQAYKRWDTILQ